MKNAIKILIAFALLSLGLFGQTVTLSSTTLGAAVTSVTQTTITLASTTGMLGSGPNGQVNTVLYMDREMDYVNTVVDSTHVTVARGKGVGASVIPALHVNGAKVYWAATQTIGSTIIPATRFFRLEQPNAEASGACTATNELALPKVYVFSGDIWDCRNGSSGGQWIFLGNGTAGQAGTSVAAFCTGALTSAGTDFIGNTACATTTVGVKQVVSSSGTLANLYVVAGTAVTGGASADVLTVLKNGSATTLTCTFATGGAATTCSDTAHSVSVSAGDQITFQFVTATSDAGQNLSVKVGLY